MAGITSVCVDMDITPRWKIRVETVCAAPMEVQVWLKEFGSNTWRRIERVGPAWKERADVTVGGRLGFPDAVPALVRKVAMAAVMGSPFINDTGSAP